MRSVFVQGAIVKEIIVVDDGSTDGTADLISAIVREDSRVRLEGPLRRGVSASLTEAFKISTQPWVSVLCPKDRFTPGRFRRLLAKSELDRVDFCFSAVSAYKHEPWNLASTFHSFFPTYEESREEVRESGLIKAITRGNPVLTLSNLLFRRHVWDLVGGFRIRRFVNDWEFAVRAILDNRIRSAFYDEELIYCRPHADKSTVSAQVRCAAEALCVVRDVQTKFPEYANLLVPLERRFERRLRQTYTKRRQQLFSNGIYEKEVRSEEVRGPCSRALTLACISPILPIGGEMGLYWTNAIKQLSFFYQITVISDIEKSACSWIDAHVLIRSTKWFEANCAKFDRIIYYVGNSTDSLYSLKMLPKFPGVVFLHDVNLQKLHLHLIQNSRSEIHVRRELFRIRGAGAFHELALRSPEEVIGSLAYVLSGEVTRQAFGLVVYSTKAKSVLASAFPRLVAQSTVSVCQLAKRDIGSPTSKTFGSVNRRVVRRRLQIADDEFIVSVFGAIKQTRYSDVLVNCWNSWVSSHETMSRAKLVFVGGEGSLEKREWVSGISEEIASHNKNYPYAPITITGWVAQEAYEDWLISTDLAIQFWDETEIDVPVGLVDSLGWGLPVIINQKSVISDELGFLPVVRGIPGNSDFDRNFSIVINQLKVNRNELDLLGGKALTWSNEVATRQVTLAAYRNAIESAYGVSGIIRRRINPRLNGTLWVDIGDLNNSDRKNGIHRVVRSIVKFLISRSIKTKDDSLLRVELVRIEQTGFVQALRYTESITGLEIGCLGQERSAQPQDGDIVLFLEINYGISTHQEMLRYWKISGARFISMVHDILPITNPSWFPDGNSIRFSNSLSSLLNYSDLILTNSVFTKNQLITNLNPSQEMHVLPLGCDLESSLPSFGRDPIENSMLAKIKLAKGFKVLMVGTIEPRKGHSEVLEVFNKLWNSLPNANQYLDTTNLVLVGSQGWMVEEFCATIRAHSKINRQLWWFDNASDEVLDILYAECDLLLMASFGEGYGLPIAEATRHDKPIIARDIPVFREVASRSRVLWFNDSLSLYSILSNLPQKLKIIDERSQAFGYHTWNDTGVEICKYVSMVGNS